MSKKPTNAELELRYAEVAQMIVEAQNREDIVRYASKKWNVSDRTVDKYISRAHGKLRLQSNKKISIQRDIALNRYENLYKRNLEAEDLRECRQVQDSISKLLGINAPEKTEHSGEMKLTAPKFLQREYSGDD